MVNTSKFSKSLKNVLVYNIIIILTVTCTVYNYTVTEFGNNPGAEKYDPVSYQHDLQIKKNLKETDPSVIIVKDIHITEVESDEIRESIKIGIKYAIQKTSKIYQDVLYPSDFTDKEETEFKSWSDTDVSPAPFQKNFTFITYGRKAFRYIRRLFDINSDDYRQSFCKSSLRKVSNPGASASVFYCTEDDKFIMKSVQLTEYNVLKNLLPAYTEHMEKNPGSLLPKFSGLYGYKRKSIDIKLVSVNNILPSNIKIHLKYDLKGSTFYRAASINEKLKQSPTFKDLDFDENNFSGIYLMPNTLSGFLKSMKSDCDFLKKYNVTNYSLLLGVHKIDKDTSTCSQAASARFTRLMVNSTGMESIQEHTGNFLDEKNCPSLRGSIPAKSGMGERLLLFVGIIDILRDYGLLEKIEKNLKTIKVELTPGIPPELSSISVQPPDVYASRFLEFMTKSVFKPFPISKR